MTNPLMYDFRSLMGAELSTPNEDTSSTEPLKSMIVQRLEDACGLLSPELWHGFYNVGRLKIDHNGREIRLQHFRTPGINKMLVFYYDRNSNLLIYFTCEMEKRRFIVMRCERGFQGPVFYNSLCGLHTSKPTDIAYLREATENLSDNIKATFDSAFAN